MFLVLQMVCSAAVVSNEELFIWQRKISSGFAFIGM